MPAPGKSDVSPWARTWIVAGRHDPCIAPRLVPVAEAMLALVLVDAWLALEIVIGGCPSLLRASGRWHHSQAERRRRRANRLARETM